MEERYMTIINAFQFVALSKNQSAALVGGHRRLERLVSQQKIRAVKTTDRQNGRWECNGSDVVRHTIDPNYKR